jgi:iron complex outermembrane recepter protein
MSGLTGSRAPKLHGVGPKAATRSVWFVLVTCLSPMAWGFDAANDVGQDLTRLSLEQLSNVEVTSVSKAPEVLQRAAATIYVITHEQIMRSGATSLMEALRLAPNLLITQVSSAGYTISARGLSGNPQAQNFSNKLLMLIDGRSVYTPLYSGIYSDAQDVLLEDIDRIEIVSWHLRAADQASKGPR